jgi:septum formation protein
MRLVLASTSAYRRELLGRLGVAFETAAPDVDEGAWKGRGLAPREVARQLARAKAEAVARLVGDGATVIGSDQVCALGSETFGKPGTAERACEQLARLAGRTHELLTAVCVVGPVRGERGAVQHSVWEHTDTARLSMRALDAASIARYVAADRPLDCAGSYKLEARGIALFEKLECADHTAIVGLPLVALTLELVRRGWVLP